MKNKVKVNVYEGEEEKEKNKDFPRKQIQCQNLENKLDLLFSRQTDRASFGGFRCYLCLFITSKNGN